MSQAPRAVQARSRSEQQEQVECSDDGEICRWERFEQTCRERRKHESVGQVGHADEDSLASPPIESGYILLLQYYLNNLINRT